MANDPRYVRLAEHMATSVLADIAGGSGWSISGMQVKPFPKGDDAAERFVRAKLVAGLLESASKAEHTEMTKNDEALAEAVAGMQDESGQSTGLQEAQVQAQAAEAAERLARHRQSGESGDEEGSSE